MTPMPWCEPKYHKYDCYFCLTNLEAANKNQNISGKYQSTISIDADVHRCSGRYWNYYHVRYIYGIRQRTRWKGISISTYYKTTSHLKIRARRHLSCQHFWFAQKSKNWNFVQTGVKMSISKRHLSVNWGVFKLNLKPI